jgi:hypothetical protein
MTIQLTNKWTCGYTTLEQSVENLAKLCHWGSKPGLKVFQPHTCLVRFSYEQACASCLGEWALTHPTTLQCNAETYTNKHNRVNVLNSIKETMFL